MNTASEVEERKTIFKMTCEISWIHWDIANNFELWKDYLQIFLRVHLDNQCEGKMNSYICYESNYNVKILEDSRTNVALWLDQRFSNPLSRIMYIIMRFSWISYSQRCSGFSINSIGYIVFSLKKPEQRTKEKVSN